MFDIEKEQGHFSVCIVNLTLGGDTCTSMSIKKCMFILLIYLPILEVNKRLLQKIHLTSLLMLKMLWEKNPKTSIFK